LRGPGILCRELFHILWDDMRGNHVNVAFIVCC
jgi:hypothetical protein